MQTNPEPLATGKANGKAKLLVKPTGKATDVAKYPRSMLDEVFEILVEKDLVDERFKADCCRKFYKVGVDKVLKISIRAMDANNPKAYFISALKQEYNAN